MKVTLVGIPLFTRYKGMPFIAYPAPLLCTLQERASCRTQLVQATLHNSDDRTHNTTHWCVQPCDGSALATLPSDLRRSSLEQDEDNEDEDEDNEDDMSLPQHLPGEKRGKDEPRLPASELEAHRFLGCRLKMLASEGKVHEGCAAFGRLAELATRGGAAAMTTAPQEVLLQLSPSSLMAKLRNEVAARERGGGREGLLWRSRP